MSSPASSTVGSLSNTAIQTQLTDVYSVVQPVVNVDGVVSNLGDLAHSLVDRIQSGEVDATGLENLLVALGGSTGLSNLNHVIAEAA
jgi:hypothetical protein